MIPPSRRSERLGRLSRSDYSASEALSGARLGSSKLQTPRFRPCHRGRRTLSRAPLSASDALYIRPAQPTEPFRPTLGESSAGSIPAASISSGNDEVLFALRSQPHGRRSVFVPSATSQSATVERSALSSSKPARRPCRACRRCGRLRHRRSVRLGSTSPSFAWLKPTPAPFGWMLLVPLSGNSLLWYPPSMKPINGDPYSVSAALKDRSGQ